MENTHKYYIGIDLGGTFIKGGIVDDTGNILVQDKVLTESKRGANRVVLNIVNLCRSLLERANMEMDEIVGVGMGVPGMVDSEKGEVIYSNNLNVEHYLIKKEIEKLISIPIKIANDANVAVLGEVKFGCAKEYDTVVMLTLGTGIGGGIVINGKLFEGNKSAGAELGCMVIVENGEQCTCGRKGCFEAYASATALIRDTKRALIKNKSSKMWEIGGVENVNGQTAFKYKDSDPIAFSVIENYINKLGLGLTNYANIFRPEAIILGGGVSEQGDSLIKPLQQFVDREIYAADRGPRVKIIKATLGNLAGVLGAAALWME